MCNDNSVKVLENISFYRNFYFEVKLLLVNKQATPLQRFDLEY